MSAYLFDCETNGLLDQLTKVHSLVLKNVEAGEVISAHAGSSITIEDALRLLMDADEIIGHNIIKFDIPALQKVYPWFKPQGRVIDTLVCSRVIWTNLALRDAALVRKNQLPKKLTAAHSLKAWGYRLGVLKGDYGETTDWEDWSEEMQTYCEQDVEVTAALWALILKKRYAQQCLDLEHKFATLMAAQERNGFTFNEEKASELYGVLVARRLTLSGELKNTFPPEQIETTFIPKVNNAKQGYVKGVPFTKVKLVEFNPSSRQQISRRLKALGWEPEEFTPSGEPKVDDKTLQALPWPEAQVLAEYFLVEKRIGQLAEGDQAWLRLARKGRIHGGINTNGAVTGRCTHSNPNVAQVPKVGTPYGAESRALFSARRGWSLVGVDLQGLELRCLAHFLARYDAGSYARLLLEGDPHWATVQAMGLASGARDDNNLAHKLFRDGAKTFIYGFLYGAGDAKAGSIVAGIIRKLLQANLPVDDLRKQFFGDAPLDNVDALKRAGKRLKTQFLKNFPALKKLQKELKEKVAANGGWIKGLDGRKLHIRSDHAVLNTLLQSAGALLSKVATIIAFEKFEAAGWVLGKDFAPCAHVHDEVQIECKPAIAERLGQLVVEAMQDAGKYFNFRIQIDGEAKVGYTWYDTH